MDAPYSTVVTEASHVPPSQTHFVYYLTQMERVGSVLYVCVRISYFHIYIQVKLYLYDHRSAWNIKLNAESPSFSSNIPTSETWMYFWLYIYVYESFRAWKVQQLVSSCSDQ